MRCSSSTTVSRPTRRASPAGTGGSVGRNLAVDGTPPRSPDQLPAPRPRRSWNASRAARPRSSGGPEAPTYVADAECRRLLTSVKTNSGTVQVRRPITLDGLTHIRCQRRVHERHREMLDHATRDLRPVVSRAHRRRSRRSGALQVGAIPVSATCQPLQWSRSSAENSSPRARPPDYDESSARRDHQASAAVIALSASWMPSPTSPAVAAQCKGTRATAPGSQRCSSRVSGSGAVPS